MLISSLPPAHHEALLKTIIAHPLVGAVRYNTGMDSPYSPRETLERFLGYSRPLKKPLYVDLKGRQLRIVEWATLPYGPIILNHKVRVELPARVLFRGDDICDLKEVVDGNKIYVDPLPKYPVGRGQSLNILGENVVIEGGLTEVDRAFIKEAAELHIRHFMLSFVESVADIDEFDAEWGGSVGRFSSAPVELVLKIESQKGLDFVADATRSTLRRRRLMAARDDLMLHIGGLNMLEAEELLIAKDPRAMCASRLMLGLEQGSVTLADISDIRMRQLMGYKTFMLSDGTSRNHFEKAIGFWEEYISAYPM